MTATADVVVAGAGHNSLAAAAYLAKAGLECLVLDARPVAGGGGATKELLLPGFLFDTCSTGHTLIQANPLLRDDELGLKREYGLEYVSPDPIAHVVFPDGESFTHWLDLERALAEFARFSKRDAATYRRGLDEFAEIRTHVGAYRFNPIGYAPPLDLALAGRPGWLRRIASSAWDVIRREYESPYVQSYLLWQAFQTGQPVDSPGSGLLAHSIAAGRQERSWSVPLGGSGELARALVRFLEEHGATVVTGTRVTELVLERGRCVGVRAEDGEEYRARRAVVSTIHVKRLVEMAPAAAWGDDFLEGVDSYDAGVSVFAQFHATTEPPRLVAPGGTQTAVSAGVVGWPEEVLQTGRDVREGRLERPSWLLIATPTLVDPARAPEGRHTVKLLTWVPWIGGDWDGRADEVAAANLAALRRAAPNMTDETILASLVRSPVEVERQNEHMFRGTIHGGDRSTPNDGPRRPVPGWAQHRMPIPGLYQTGATTHPGGSITGAPGRNAAVVLLEDLGFDPRRVLPAPVGRGALA